MASKREPKALLSSVNTNGPIGEKQSVIKDDDVPVNSQILHSIYKYNVGGHNSWIRFEFL